jgi:hypothetical protein
MDNRPSVSPWKVVIFLALVFLGGLASHAMIANITAYPSRYALTALFGLLVGATELISRYRDDPMAPLTTIPGVIYIGTNAIASIGALWILQTQNVAPTFGGLPPELGQVLMAGFGTMLFFRSSLFNVRVGETEVAIGPAAVLQIILNSADRACDRLRAGPRSDRVSRIMRGVSFEQAKVQLRLHINALMQNIGEAEQKQLERAIEDIGKVTMSDEAKAYSLGLLMMNIVGEDVLERAVGVLGPLVRVPPPDIPPILPKANELSATETLSLVDLCIALDPQARKDQSADSIREDITKAIAKVKEVPIQNIIAFMLLRERFGAATVNNAIFLLERSRTRGAVSTDKPTTDDLKAATSGPTGSQGTGAGNATSGTS